jgi:hypothetical protein
MVNLSKILRVKVPPLAILISGLMIVGLLTAIGGIVDYSNQLNSSQAANTEILKQQTAELTEDTKKAESRTSGEQDSSTGYSSNTNGPAGPNSYTTSSAAIAGDHPSAAAGSSNSNTKTSYVKVFLSVNGSPKGSLTLKNTANQCQVLSQAKAQGLISSLDMRYNKGLNSYGVYIIEGIGRTDQVYWTYAVNGKPPPFGCSYIRVHNGDSINWEYIN